MRPARADLSPEDGQTLTEVTHFKAALLSTAYSFLMSIRPLLQRRAAIRSSLRHQLESRGFIEVDTPVVASELLPEIYIDPVTLTHQSKTKYLQTSPEPQMKRLLAEDSGPIFQFAQCFRSDERGPLHDTEFTMLEWYEPGACLHSTAEVVESL